MVIIGARIVHPKYMSKSDKIKIGSPLLFAFGLLLTITGALLNIYFAFKHPWGDLMYPHMIAKGFITGTNVYSDSGWDLLNHRYYHLDVAKNIYYPPSSGLIILPLGFLNFVTAEKLWVTLMMGTMIYGLWRFLTYYLAHFTPASRITILGGILCSSCTRWGFYAVQNAPLLLGVFCIFLIASIKQRHATVTALATIAVCMKASMLLPFGGILLFQRRFVTLATILGIFLLLNIAGFARMGSVAYNDYRTTMARMDAPHSQDGPYPWDSVTIERTDTLYLIHGIFSNPILTIFRNPTFNSLATAKTVTLAINLICFLCLLREGYRGRKLSQNPVIVAAFLGPLTCFSLLAVYHHHYDSILLVLPLVAYWFVTPIRSLKRSPLFTIPLSLFLAFYTVGTLSQIVAQRYGDTNVGFVKMIGGALIFLAFFVTIHVIRLLVTSASNNQSIESPIDTVPVSRYNETSTEAVYGDNITR